MEARRTIKDTEKKIDDGVQLIDHAEKYLKHKDTYKAYTKLKKNKQDTFYNEHTAEIILFESAKKYLKEHLGENKTLNISKWKAEIGTLRKEKDTLYSQMIDIRKKVEQAESVRCIELSKAGSAASCLQLLVGTRFNPQHRTAKS